MSTTTLPAVSLNLAELAARFGPMPAWRILSDPPPGEATEDDVLRLHAESKQLCELVDAILVRKTMGAYESGVGGIIIAILFNYVRPRRLGIVLPADGMLQLWAGRVRIPDVCFISRDQLPEGQLPRLPAIPDLYPDLAVEVLSPSNTTAEMTEKLHDYFQVGTRLVWYINPGTRQAEVYTSVEEKTVIDATGLLSGDPVLPGLVIPLAEVFDVGV